MGWLYELLSIGSALITPFLQKHGVTNVHFIDAIIMFLVIPFLHLMNDEDTKGIIFEENWYQGIRHMLGIYNEKVPQLGIRGPPAVADPKNKSSPSHTESIKHVIHTTSSHESVDATHFDAQLCLIGLDVTSIVVKPGTIRVRFPDGAPYRKSAR